MKDTQPPGFEARDQALADALGRYVESLESGASQRTAEHVIGWWLDWAATRGYDDLDVLDDERDGVQVMRRTAQELRSKVNGPDERLSSPSSARTYWNILAAALSFLVDEQLLSHYPARANAARSPLPSDPGNPDAQQFWTPEQRDGLMAYVNERAREAIDSDDVDHTKPVRDRALVALVAWTGVRGVEVLRSRHDDREGRDGLLWSRVDREEWTMRVRGKGGEWEDVAVPPQARPALERWYSVQDPEPEFPVIPTLHRPTLAKAGPIPPTMTVDGGRSLVERLGREAGVEDDEPLRLHGARRGLGSELYQHHSAELAQETLRHESVETTKAAYRHVDVAEQGETIGNVLSRSDE
ncbi:recombinase XerD (plasmid) [Salinigranum rubrum]|uniref:Recombinase XerD n=1 Tax=Salinigranum rubrum TaxID=755307 RepID=A0A2I8VRZ8_9EURY|nr:site-specific integrase [Salinigranum rubrum]AUV84683.1 recombinase XerD [Salinigranum rubrum]